tara:strand:- start:329 stop:430 length:102 start_codon:yes stop_codon:yes gene_type:complete
MRAMILKDYWSVGEEFLDGITRKTVIDLLKQKI